MRLFPPGTFRRGLALLTAVAFAATGPGLAGIEVAAHLSGLVDLTHERQPHVEGAGHTGHADQCQLGTAAFGMRLPALGAPVLRSCAERSLESVSAGLPAPRPAPLRTGLPRAPPA